MVRVKRIRMLLLCLVLPLIGLCSVNAEEEKLVAITFDDGPSGHYTAELLEGLEERGVKATFFLCGYRVDQFPTLTRQIAQAGHEIGTHSDAHRYFSEMSPTELCKDLTRSVEKLRRATGREPTLLRPPGGIYDRQALKQTTCADLPIILWSVDPDDWCCNCSDTVAKRVLDKVEDGDIILLHDMSDSSVEAALEIIDSLREQGFTFLTVSQLAQRKGAVLEGGKVYGCF